MTIVDTSVWIDFFTSKTPVALERVIPFGQIVTCLPVIQEVLQGFRDEGAFRKARSAMTALPIVESPLDQSIYLEAVDLYRTARRLGVTIRSSVDCMIAACAIRNNLEVLHRDRDYDELARVSPLRARAVRW